MLKLKKAISNWWYRSGRWHKVYPRPGRTQFLPGDLCQFKPDLQEVQVEQVLPHASYENVNLYRVRSLFSGHCFPCYGNELLLLKRAKPRLEIVKPQFKRRVKPNYVVRPKPRYDRQPILTLPGAWKKFSPDKETLARVSFWDDTRERWIWQDFRNEREVEERYWTLVERYRIRPEDVSVEWFKMEDENVQGNDNSQPEKGVRGGGRSHHGGGTQGIPDKQGNLQQLPGNQEVSVGRRATPGRKARHDPKKALKMLKNILKRIGA